MERPPTAMAPPIGAPLGLVEPQSVATYDTLADAQKAVAYLVEQKLPAARLTVVGTDLRTVTGPVQTASWGNVVTVGAASGVMWGLLLAVLLWIFVPGHSVVAMIGWGLLCGIVYGVLAQVVQHGLTRRPDAPAVVVVATHYEVLAEAVVADEARDRLAEKPLVWRAPTGNTAMLPVVRDVAPDQTAAVEPASPPSPPSTARIEVRPTTAQQKGTAPAGSAAGGGHPGAETRVPVPPLLPVSEPTSPAAGQLAELMARLSNWSSQPIGVPGRTAQEAADASANEITLSLPRIRDDTVDEGQQSPASARRLLPQQPVNRSAAT